MSAPFVSIRIRYLFFTYFYFLKLQQINQVFLLPDYVHKKTQKVWSFIFQIIFLTIFWFLINIHIFMAWIMTELLLIFSQNVDIIRLPNEVVSDFSSELNCRTKSLFLPKSVRYPRTNKDHGGALQNQILELQYTGYFNSIDYRFDFWNLETEKKKSNPYSSRHKIIFCWTSQINVGIVTLWN